MRSFYLTVTKVSVALLFLSVPAAAQDATAYVELPRFQQVNERLYRGAQPLDGGVDRLHELGINTIINLRGVNEMTRAEEAKARAQGLNYFNVPLPRWGRPEDADVARVLELIAAPENGRVFIHCKAGVDRTGMIVALYRMSHDGWSSQKALAEAEQSGMHGHQFWMRDYAKDYGDRVQKLGPETALTSPAMDADFDDRIGAGMRVMERGAFHVHQAATHFLHMFSVSSK